MIASIIVSGYGEVILNLLRGGIITGGDYSDTDDGHDDDDEGDGGGEGDLHLLRGGAAFSLGIAASIYGKRVNDARTVFLSASVQPEPAVAHHPPSDPPSMNPPLKGLP
ncbi:hypothetical protein Tco_0411059 [Tanacetum coccineum]